MSTEADRRARLEAVIRANPVLMGVMQTARTLELPDWLIVSGAIYQGVWNHLTGRDAQYAGILADQGLLRRKAAHAGWQGLAA